MKHYRILKTEDGFMLQRANSFFGIMGVWKLVCPNYVCETFETIEEITERFNKILKGRFVPVIKVLDIDP